MKITHLVIVPFLFLFTAIAQADALSDRIEAGMAAADRVDSDKARDASRKPAQVLAFLGVKEGMTVLDAMAGGGYYSEIFAAAVGDSGKVYSQNSEGALKFRDGANKKAMDARLANNRLPNTEMIVGNIGELGLEGKIDFAFTALNLHDMYNRGEAAAVEGLKAIRATLKPGGIFGVIDHVGATADAPKTLHRIQPSMAESLLTQAGFTIEARSDILKNPNDNHTKGVFDPSLGRNTDRFIIRAVK